MLSNHKLQVTLDEIKEITRIDMALYNESGKILASTFLPGEEFEAAVVDFAKSMAESQMLSGYHFFKVIVEDELKYILFVHAASEEAYMVGRLSVSQIRGLADSCKEQFDRNHFMQNILLGNLLVVDMYNKARKFHIEQVERVVFVISVEGKKDAYLMELVKNMFGGSGRDFVTEVDEQNLILVKDTRELKGEEELEHFAEMMVDRGLQNPTRRR